MSPTVRTTLALPEELLRAADQAIKDGKARSRNELFVTALRHELAAMERAEIDAAFAEMGGGGQYQEEARKISEEFAQSDWEALQRSDRQA
ncbi:MAG: CopG family ribbon-helix-helix protein [Dehalococcoidia bacterium]